MQFWAKLDENNVVENVTVGNESDPDKGYNWLIENIGGVWIDNTNDDGMQIAGIGSTYDEVNNRFIPPKPFDSWIYNSELNNWEAPIPYPVDGKDYFWDEETISWLEFEVE